MVPSLYFSVNVDDIELIFVIWYLSFMIIDLSFINIDTNKVVTEARSVGTICVLNKDTAKIIASGP